MKKTDVILAIICGLSVSWIAADFFKRFWLIFFIILPLLSVIGLWLVDLIGKKFLFVHQVGKFVLAGAFADVVDIRAYQLLILLIPFSSVVKTISFFVATFVKYFSDKHWTFQKHDKDDKNKEKGKFFLVATIGAVINGIPFYFLTQMKIPIFSKQIGISAHIWVELCIILAAIIAGAWNFLGYKFIVFKK